MSTQPAPQPPEPRKQPSPKPSRAAGLGRGVRTVVYIAIAVITTIFLLSNSQSVEVNFIFGTAQTPLFLALGVALILGALLALGGVGIYKVRHRSAS